MITTSAFSKCGLMRQMSGVSLAVILLLTTPTLAASVRVEQDGSGDFVGIQAAVDISASGDTILIGPGSYNQAHSIYIEPWGASTDVFVDISGKDLTLIGSSNDEVFVGPDVYYSTYQGPIGFFRIDKVGPWRVENVTIRNCYGGVYGGGELNVENCILEDQAGAGLYFFDGRCIIENCIFTDNRTGIHSSGSDELYVEKSEFIRNQCYLANVQDAQILDSVFEGKSLLFYGSGGSVRRTRGVESQIRVIGSVEVEISNCNFSFENFAGLYVGGAASVSVDSSSFSSNNYAVGLSSGGSLVVHNSHILSTNGLNGSLVKCFDYPFAETTLIDLKNNFWGTNDSTEIAAGIWDRNDDPALNVVVEFEPFTSGPVPTERKNLGDIKSMFR